MVPCRSKVRHFMLEIHGLACLVCRKEERKCRGGVVILYGYVDLAEIWAAVDDDCGW
jgi:hypothetical protein